MAKPNDAPPLKNNGSDNAAFIQAQQDANLVAAIQSQKEQQDRALVVQLMQAAQQRDAYLQQQVAMAQQQAPQRPYQPTRDAVEFPSYYLSQERKSRTVGEGSLSAVQELWGKRGTAIKAKSAVSYLFGDRFK